MYTLKLRNFLFIGLMLTAACKGEEVIPEENNDGNEGFPEPTETTIVINTSGMSRVAYANEGIDVKWSKGDKVSIFTSEKDFTEYEADEDGSPVFNIVDGQNKPEGYINSYVFWPAGKADRQNYKATVISMEGQRQDGNNSTAHLTDFTYMFATPTNLDKAINMKHQTAQIKFLMNVPEDVEASLIKKLKFEADKEIFVLKTDIDGNKKKVTKTLLLDLNLKNEEINCNNNRLLVAYMMILPTDVNDCNLTVSLLDDNGNTLAVKKENNITREYVAGYQHYALMVDNPDLTAGTVLSESNVKWTQFGPGMSGNNKIAFWHPTDRNCLYISPNMGNSYISIDGGLTYQTILDHDAPSYKGVGRGPRGFTSIDFSREDEKFGFATDEKNKGLFVTYNKGKSWQIVESFLHAASLGNISKYNTYLGCVTVDPNNDNIWYTGGGGLRNLGRILFPKDKPHGVYSDNYLESNIRKKSLGVVWKTTDKGNTWKLINKGLDNNADIESIIVSPNNGERIFMSTSHGFYRSDDGGENWIRKDIGSGNDVVRSMSMHYDRNTRKITLFAVCSITWKVSGRTLTDDEGGVYRSDDEGETWQNINGNLALDMTQFNKNYSVKESFYNVACYYMGMSKNDYKAKYPDMPEKITQRVCTIEVDPKNVNHLFLTNDYSNASRNNFKPGNLWRSTDGGKNWFVTFRNDRNFMPGSSDAAYWSNRNNPLGNNVYFRYLKEWTLREDYDQKSCNFVKFNCDGSIIHTQMAKVGFMSYDDGDTWVDIDDEYTDKDNPDSFVGAGNSNLPGHGFYQDERYPGQVFCCAGENQLWITNDRGGNVREGALGAENVQFTGQEMSLSCYAIDPKDKAKHYALFFRQYNKGKLMISNDYGKNWSVQGTAIPDWETVAYGGDQSVHQLCLIIDKENTNNMYFCVPWNAGDLEYVGNSVTGYGVHKSSDGGKTWKTVNTGLPVSDNGKGVTVNAPSVHRICFDPENPSILYAAVNMKNGGLYKSVNKGETWSEVESTKFMTIHNGEVSNAGINDIHFAADGAVYVTVGAINADAKDKSCGLWVSYNNMKSWIKLFSHPYTCRVETARYNPKIVLITALSNYGINYINPGTYISRDGGITWAKINAGNGQSDRVNDIAIDYTVKGRYYASTYGSGWYYADDPLCCK